MTPSPGPVATEQLRRQNTALLLRRLRADGPTSRAELAQATGLAKATVSTIVGDLQQHGVVRDAPAPTAPDAEPRLGRPGRPVELDGAHLVALGLEVNVDYVAATAIDLAGRTRLQTRHALGPDDLPLDRVTDLAQTSLRDLEQDGRQVLGVAVAVPGLVDHAAGVVVTAPNLGWHDLPLRSRLAQSLPPGCPLRVDNDANVAAVAEATWGAARGCSPVLYLTGTVGLGAGLVVDGSVHRGAAGFAGEVGHAPIGGSDERCACGRHGCWETTVGLPAALRAAGLDGRTSLHHDAPLRHDTALHGDIPLHGDTSLQHDTPLHGDPVQAAVEMARRAEQDDRVAAALGQVARSLASGVVTLVSVLDPQVVVLGGYFVPLGPWLLPVVRRALTDDVVGASSRRCRVALSTLGLHAASLGAAADVLADVFSGQTPLV